MLVPKSANCQYRYGSAHYQYWFQFWHRLSHIQKFPSSHLSYFVNFILACLPVLMVIVLASLGLIRHHFPRRRHANKLSCPHRTAFFCRRPAMPLPSSNAEGAPPFQCFLIVVFRADVDCPCLAGVKPAPSPHQCGKQCQYQCGHSSIPVLGINQCPYWYGHCRDGIHFQYGNLLSACTSIGIAVMAFISSMGTCQAPVPVLAFRDGVLFQYGYASAHTSFGTIHYQQ